jgi:hypothetical protein
MMIATINSRLFFLGVVLSFLAWLVGTGVPSCARRAGNARMIPLLVRYFPTQLPP